MQIFIAKNNGFCKGVERAVKTANAVCQEGVYIFGDLIHNEKVVAQIESKGAKTVYDINEVPNNSKVVIRSHGVQKSVYELLKNKNCEIIDCTCGFVKRTQEIVSEKSQEGYAIVIAGEVDHPEVVGLTGWACDGAKVVVTDGNNFD